MFLVPYVAFLVAESVQLSGFLVLIISAVVLSLYGRPNMHPGRAQQLNDSLQMLSYISKTLACVFMGISAPLHLKHMKGHEMYSTG